MSTPKQPTPKKPTPPEKNILLEIKKYPVIYDVESVQAKAWERVSNASGKTVKQCQNVFKKFGAAFVLCDDINGAATAQQESPLARRSVDANVLASQMQQLDVKPLLDDLESLLQNLPAEERIKLLKQFKAIAQVDASEK